MSLETNHAASSLNAKRVLKDDDAVAELEVLHIRYADDLIGSKATYRPRRTRTRRRRGSPVERTTPVPVPSDQPSAEPYPTLHRQSSIHTEKHHRKEVSVPNIYVRGNDTRVSNSRTLAAFATGGYNSSHPEAEPESSQRLP